LDLRSTALDKLSLFDRAIEDATRLIDMPDADSDLVVSCLRRRALAFVRLGHLEDAVHDFSRVQDLAKNPDIRLWAIASRGMMLLLSDKKTEALSDLNEAIEVAEFSPSMKAILSVFRSVLHMGQSRWDEAYRDLESAFHISVKDATDEASPIAFMIGAILRSAQNDAGWRPRVTEITRLFALHNSLPVLGNDLVRGLPELSKANLNETGLDAWVAVWHEVGAPHDALTVPLRLLQTGVAFLKTKDEGVLFELPKEERSILRQALNLPPEGEES
jgi:tetratricopeptide (TPR) repeat protein